MWEPLLPAYSGNQFPSSKNAKVKSKKMSPRRVNANMNMSMEKPIALNRAEGTKLPQLENAKTNEKRYCQGMGLRI